MNELEKLSDNEKAWRYEMLARDILNLISREWGLSSFDWRAPGRQTLRGKVTSWKCDLIAYQVGDRRLIFECKYIGGRKGVDKNPISKLFLSVEDTGSSAGFLITTVPPQKSARELAAGINIGLIEIRIGENFDVFEADLIKLCGQMILGACEDVGFDEECDIVCDNPETGEVFMTQSSIAKATVAISCLGRFNDIVEFSICSHEKLHVLGKVRKPVCVPKSNVRFHCTVYETEISARAKILLSMHAAEQSTALFALANEEIFGKVTTPTHGETGTDKDVTLDWFIEVE